MENKKEWDLLIKLTREDEMQKQIDFIGNVKNALKIEKPETVIKMLSATEEIYKNRLKEIKAEIKALS